MNPREPRAEIPEFNEFIRAFLRLGIFVGGCGLVMSFMQPPNSAEFVLSVCSATLGGGLVLAAIGVQRWFNR